MNARDHHQSYGIIPLKKVSGEWQALLIHREKGFWEFPKGHAEEGESSLETACRELTEETGLTLVNLLEEQPYQMHYNFFYQGEAVDKTVFYYLGEVDGEITLQNQEVVDSCWVPWKKVRDFLTYDNLKELVDRIGKI